MCTFAPETKESILQTKESQYDVNWYIPVMKKNAVVSYHQEVQHDLAASALAASLMTRGYPMLWWFASSRT